MLSTSLLRKSINDPKKASKYLSCKMLGFVGHSDFTRFIVLSRSRTGSNLLISLLNSHPNIFCENEVFAKLNGRNHEDILARVYAKQAIHIKAKGFKIFYYHPTDDKLSDIWNTLISDKSVKVIHLKRRNVLRTVTSRKILESTKEYMRRKSNGCNDIKPKKTEFSVRELHFLFNETRNYENKAENDFQNHDLLSLYYEDLARDTDETVKKIVKFLGINHMHPSSTNLAKQNPQQLEVLINNFYELKSAFLETEWEPFFEEQDI